jgi:nucleoid DNA-binding protein
MRENGLSYVDASRIYNTMVAVIEDGVCAGAAIRIGRVGVISPVHKPPRTVSQNCKMGKGRKVIKSQHIFNLGPRIGYKFRLFRHFMATRSLNWFNEM